MNLRTPLRPKQSAAKTTDLNNFFPDAYKCGTMANPDIGLVYMNKYKLWLASYGLSMSIAPTINTSCKAPS